MSEKPLFDFHIFCCTNQREAGKACCAEKGSEELRDYLKNRVKEAGISSTRVNTSGCLGRCDLGPVMVIYPEGIWYRCPTKEAIDEVIAEHLQNSRVVEHLQLKRDQKRL